MKISIYPLKPNDIKLLDQARTLYSVDFRAIAESMKYEIASMWKYENLTPWLTRNKYVTVNEDYCLINYPFENKYLILDKAADAKTSVYKRLDVCMPEEIKKLWVAVPHPDADRLARVRRLKLNYSYQSFRKRNNKILQKKYLGDLTPRWTIIKGREHLNDLIKSKGDGYIKRAEGSGGYAVFKVSEIKNNRQFNQLLQQQENSVRWYCEETVVGTPYSIQCLKEGNTIKIFGFAKQRVTEGKHFSGAEILDLRQLRGVVKAQSIKSLRRLYPLLKGYEGFFGIDFILKKNGEMKILEANIRLTAVTIPTLLNNMAGSVGSKFREDNKEANIKKDEMVLTVDMSNNLRDTLSSGRQSGSLNLTQKILK